MNEELASVVDPVPTSTRRPLPAIWAVFALLDGVLLFVNSEWFPSTASLLFPTWAFTSGLAAIAYSNSAKLAIRRFKLVPLTVHSAFWAVLSGAAVVIILERMTMVPLAVPPGSLAMRAVFVLMITVLVPVVEEILFRGIILDRLLRNRGAIAAIVLSSLAAAVCHEAVLAALVEQIVIASIYIWRGESLWVSILAHVSLNSMSLLTQMNK